MKRIVLIRHAKSSWAEENQEDLERPLNQRGRLAAPVIGAWLSDHGLKPDLVWLSPAKRSLETWTRIASEIGKGVKTREHKALYMADPSTALEVLRLTDQSVDTVALVGHQPGIGALTRKLADGRESETLSRAYRKYPTGAVSVLEANIKNWSKLSFNEAKFRNFVVPKELV
jgi:phosphohistidine phosphatase